MRARGRALSPSLSLSSSPLRLLQGPKGVHHNRESLVSMTFSITIDPTRPHSSDHSLSDEEGSSGVQVSVPSDPGSHEYQDYDEWAHLPYPDELKPSDSASRPRTSQRSRTSLHGSRSASGRRQTSRRQMVPDRESYAPRGRRHRSPESPESVDSAEDYEGHLDRPLGRSHNDRRLWPPVPPAPGYAHSSSSSGPSYNAYPHGHGPYGHPSHPPSDQLIRLGQPTYGPYAYGSHGASGHPFFPHDHHPAHPRHGHRQQQPAPARADSRSQPQPMGHHGYGAAAHFNSQELMPYGPSYYQYRDPYAMVPGITPQPYFPSYPQVPPPSQTGSGSPAPSAMADAANNEVLARLEKLIMEERTERETREAARQAAIEREAAEKAAQAERTAHDKKIAEQAAALARADAEKKAAEDAAKAKEEAEKAANAAATQAPKKPPAEKKKPIKFKDAVGRKFSFPFELCSTWQGMEELIRQAFLHIEVIGPHVAEGHYDLVGPNGDIILPQVWETVIEPDWTITMHMWPIPEKPKDTEPAPPGDAAKGGKDDKKKPEPAGNNKKPRAKAGDAGRVAMWVLGGSNRTKPKQPPKPEKKPDKPPQ